MATTLATILTNARTTLNEPTASFWSDAELLVHAIDGVRDLWRGIIDLDEGHFQTRDESHVSQVAGDLVLTGVPADVFRIELLEPRDLTTTSSAQNLTYEPKKTNHADFTAARGLGTVDPAGRIVYFALKGAGSPVDTPTVEVAPKISATVLLRLIYIPTLGTLTSGSNNPIPGESDKAVTAWVIAMARAKERAKRDPDPEWMAVYASEKAHIMTALKPRQTQEPTVAEALYESFWYS